MDYYEVLHEPIHTYWAWKQDFKTATQNSL